MCILKIYHTVRAPPFMPHTHIEKNTKLKQGDGGGRMSDLYTRTHTYKRDDGGGRVSYTLSYIAQQQAVMVVGYLCIVYTQKKG